MKRIAVTLLLATIISLSCKRVGEVDIDLQYDNNISLEYDQVIAAYETLARHYPEARLVEMGQTDIGKPLHLFMISKERDFDPASIRKKGKCIIMINNGIHPGEPEGIDASIQFSWDILSNKNDLYKYLDNIVLAIIPVYNIGGALDRSEYYRTNQNGPVYKGRRRNARNMDLNRDFAKQETKNARSFAGTFTYLNPDVFVDTHVTNGSDHQYTVTLIPTLYSKLDPAMASFFKEKMLPGLYDRMEKNSEYGMIPYVQTRDRANMRSGIIGYNDNRYYSTGYTSMFNCYSFMTENLVYKYFPDRVRSVVDFLTQLVDFTSENATEIRELKDAADIAVKKQKEFELSWKLDENYSEELLFKGYEYSSVESPGSNRRSRFYDHDKPWTDTIPYFTKFDAALKVTKPYAYIIPQAWEDIADKLRNNKVEIYRLKEDISIEVETYYIDKSEASPRTTQGHHVNMGVEVHSVTQPMQYYKGDFVVLVNQFSNKYIVEMLEPHAPDSYFVWNFFDSILESHDFYSIWGFESHLMELVEQDEELRQEFERKKTEDPDFASDPLAQLQYLYQKAPYSEIEKWNRLYPVTRLNEITELPLGD
ncbi:MAG TPA: hypothetical protein VMW76_07575 [Bacteroidales bacterium]|nr:hypothetical protein [Bacteroidales bacterium]